MPELPEVETTLKGLKLFVGINIKIIKLHTTSLRYPIPKKISIITKNSKIQSIYRIAKYIIIELENGYSLIVHLGMSGRLKKYPIKKDINIAIHDHVEIIFKNDYKIVLNDPRRFGVFDIVKTSKINSVKYFCSLGLDPFDKRLNEEYLYEKIKNSHRSIKSILLDQKIISGIGNIYACEILFDCNLSPLCLGKKLSRKKAILLIKSIKNILKKAIINKGSTIKNYKSVGGQIGNFQNNFKVYNKEGQYISFRGKQIQIIKIKQQGRSTYYCPGTQK